MNFIEIFQSFALDSFVTNIILFFFFIRKLDHFKIKVGVNSTELALNTT